MSFFVTINKAEKGGELFLYDVLWEDNQTKQDLNTDDEIILADGKKLNLSNKKSKIKRMPLKPDNCDLIIFNGAEIWHKVTKVKSNKSKNYNWWTYEFFKG